jgi:chromosome segregation ATPase
VRLFEICDAKFVMRNQREDPPPQGEGNNPTYSSMPMMMRPLPVCSDQQQELNNPPRRRIAAHETTTAASKMMNNHNSLFDEGLTLDRLAQHRGNNSDDATSAKTSSTYAEMVEEVERASEILAHTQTRLFRVQEETRISNEKVNRLEIRLSNQDGELVRLHGENSLMLDEGQELRDAVKILELEAQERDTGRVRPVLEQRLRKAVLLLKKDLEASKEKQQASADDARNQKARVQELGEANTSLKGFLAQMEKKDKEAQEKLDTCKEQLRQATEESTNMIEEVAELREDLKRTKKIAEQKDAIIRREVTEKVKEKIRLEVRDTVAKQVTEKVTRQVKAEMKVEREKEIGSLREQFKKVFKENAQLKEKLNAAQAKLDKLKKVEDVIPNLKYEISRLLSLLDKVKKDQELAVSKLETHYRKKIQTIMEESAKEKWAHTTEIRKQLSQERDKEVNEFTERIESLSKQTDRLLQNAEREKESYANQVKQRVIEEKKREMTSLKEKLAICTRESDELLLEAAKNKQSYGEQIRQQLEEEKRRDVYKHTYRIEVLATEKENLQKRIDAFEEELSWAWKGNEEKSDQLKESQSDLKILEDDIFKLKRKNQNLNTLVERYKEDFDDVSSEYSKSRKEYKEALLQSEQRSHDLKEKLKQAEFMLSQIRNISIEEGDHQTPKLLAERTKLFEEEISRLRQENGNLSASVTQLEHERVQPRQSEELLGENIKLREKLDNLTELVHTLRRESLEMEMIRLKDESLQDSEKREEAETDDEDKRAAIPESDDDSDQAANLAMLAELRTENSSLKRRLVELNALLEEHKKTAHQTSDELSRKTKEYQSTLRASHREVELMKERLDYTTSMVNDYRFEKAEAIKELERAKQNSGEVLTVASEDDTAQLNIEIQTLERLLERYKVGDAEVLSEEEISKHYVHKTLVSSEEEIPNLRRGLQNRISPSKADSINKFRIRSSRHAENTGNDDQSKLERSAQQHQPNSTDSEEHMDSRTLHGKIENLNYLLDEYRTELSQASHERERTKQILASEREESSRLQKRVQSLNLLLQTKEKNQAHDSQEYNEGLTSFSMAYNEKLAGLKQQLEKLNQELVTCQSERDNSTAKANETKERLEREISTLREKYAEAKNRGDRLETEFQRFVEENGEAENRADRFEGELQKFLTQDGEANRKADRLELELQEYVTKHTEAQSRADRFEAELQNFLAQDGELKNRADRLDVELKGYVVKHADAQSQADRFEKDIQKFLDEDGKARKKVVLLEVELQDITAKHAEAQSRADDLEVKLQKSATGGGEAESKVNNPLEAELQKLRTEHNEILKELKHSKRLFKEELMKSEQEIFDLLQKKLAEAKTVEQNEDDYVKSTAKLVEAKRDLEVALVTSETHARSKANELEMLLSKARNEIKGLQKQMQDLEQRRQESSSENNQKSRETVENLQALLDASRRENERIKEDLEHSIELFKEALTAWRDESKTLNEELRALRQNSSHSRSTHLTGSHHSREPDKDTSVSQRTMNSSITSRATATEEGRNQILVEDFHFNEMDVPASSPKTISSVEAIDFDSAELRDSEDGDSTSSRKQLRLSLVNKWRRETHQLIEEVEAAQIQRRENNSENSKLVDGNEASKTAASIGGSSDNNPSSSSIPEAIHGDESEMKKRVSWKAVWDANEATSQNVSNDGDETIGKIQDTCEALDIPLRSSPHEIDSNGVSNISQSRAAADNAEVSLEAGDQTDAVSVDSDEVLLREKLGSRIEEWNKTLEDFSSSILGDTKPSNPSQHSQKKSQDSVEGSASARSEKSILRTASDVASARTKKSVTWNTTVEELSFISEVATLGDQLTSLESNPEGQPISTSFNFQHAFETESNNLQQEKVHNVPEAVINEVREPPPAELDTHADHDESRDGIATPIVEAHKALEDIEYCWSISSHTATNALISFDVSGIKEHPQSPAVNMSYDDDSTLDWHLQSAGGSSTSLPFETSNSSHTQPDSKRTEVERKDHAPSTTEHLSLDSIQKQGEGGKSDTNEGTVAPSFQEEENVLASSSPSPDEREEADSPKQGGSDQVDTNLSKRSNSSSSSSHSGRVKKGSPTGEDLNENRDKPPSDVTSSKRKAGSRQVAASPSSSASMTSSSCPSSFSCSFSSSHSSHSNIRKHVDMTGEVREANSTFLVPVGEVDEAAADAASGRSKSPQKKQTGFQRALDKASRRNWSKTEIRNFMKKKRSSRKKKEESKEPSTTTEAQPDKDRKDNVSKEDESAAATSAEPTENIDRSQIVSFESKE